MSADKEETTKKRFDLFETNPAFVEKASNQSSQESLIAKFEENPTVLAKKQTQLPITESQIEQTIDPFIGKTIANRYEILSFLGKGGMSSVYKARNNLLKTTVAVKIMHKHLWTDSTAKDRFRHEAKAINELVHTNLVTLKDFGVTDEGEPYIVMDFFEGTDLGERLEAVGYLQLPKVVSIFADLCEGLGAAHDKGIIHRDIKPANVMFVSNTTDGAREKIKLVDFGIAKIVTDDVNEITQLTQTGEVFGSPLYMSPEQCLGRKVDARSDIYSLGCLAYEMITGRPPLYSDSILETFNKQVSQMPDQFLDVAPEINNSENCGEVNLNDLEYIVFKCLDKSLEGRYQSVGELLIDLNRLRSQEEFSKEERHAVKKKKQSESGKAPPRAKKRLVMWLTATAFAVVVGGGLAFISMIPKIQDATGTRNETVDASNFDRIAYSYFKQGKYDKSIALLKFGMDTYKEKGNERFLADNLKHIGNCYRLKGEFNESASYYKKAYDIYIRLRIRDSYYKECISEYAYVLDKLGRSLEAKVLREKLKGM